MYFRNNNCLIRFLITILTICSAVFAQAQQKDRNIDNLLETVSFRMYTGGVVVIEARLDSIHRPLNFILDSGSGGISLDSATCEELDIPRRPTDTTVSGIAGLKKVSFAFDRDLYVGKLKTDHLNFYINDYSLLTNTYGEKIDGIIGYGFLSKYIVHVNFDSNELKIYRPGKYFYEERGRVLRPALRRLAAQSVTIREHRRTTTPFYIDTGAGLCLLMSESFIKDSAVLLSRRRPVITQAEGLGGKKPMRLTVVRHARIAGYGFKNVPVYLYDDEVNVLSYPSVTGLIGNDLLRRFNLTFNYPNGEIHIIPNSHFYERFDYAYTGMSLYVLDNEIIADDIVEGSPAALAGIKNGDEIVSVGTNVSGNVQQYKNLLQNTKEAVKIIVRRKEALMLFSIRAVSIL